MSDLAFGLYRKTRDIVMPVCEDCRDKVDDCYNRYPGKPLQCSSLVKEYIQCVEKHRKVGHQLCVLHICLCWSCAFVGMCTIYPLDQYHVLCSTTTVLLFDSMSQKTILRVPGMPGTHGNCTMYDPLISVTHAN